MSNRVGFPVGFGVGFGVGQASQEFVSSAAYPLAFATLGISATGFVVDGTVSRFWTDSAMTTLCANSGTDVVGAIEDLSGNENHLIQTASANKPVFYSAGGVKSFRHGSIGGANRYMDNTTALYTSTQMTMITVQIVRTTYNNNGGYMFTTYRNGGWGSGGYMYMITAPAADGVWLLISANSQNVFSRPINNTYSSLAYTRRTGLDVGQSTLTAARSDGTALDAVTANCDANPANPIRVGMSNITADIIEQPFAMLVNDDITDGQWSTILAYLVSKFGAWA